MTTTSSIHFQQFVQAAGASSSEERLVFSEGAVIPRSVHFWQPVISLFDPSVKDENKRTWQVFRRSIEESYGTERIQRICKKYKWDIESLEKNGSPLLNRHVEMVQVGGSEIFVSDLQKGRETEIKWLPLEEIQRLIRNLNPFPVQRDSIPRSDLDGQFDCLRDLFVYDPVLMDKRKAILCQGMAELSHYSFLERLSKSLASKELQKNTIIPAPGPNGQEDYYIVHEVICGEGLIAYALKPLSAYSLLQPTIVFRPTESNFVGQDAIQTWLNDFQFHMGEMGYNASKDQLRSVMNDPTFCHGGQKVDLVGFSFGALCASFTLVDYWSRVREVTCFTGPSTEKEKAEQFAQMINALPVNPSADAEPLFSLNIYRNNDDVAHCVGEKHIGWGITHPNVNVEVIEFDAVQRQFATKFSLNEKLSRHSQRFLDVPALEFVAVKYGKEAINHQLDNTVKGDDVVYWEKTRRFWGAFILFPVIYAIYKVTLFMHTYLGISTFRYSKPKDSLFSLFSAKKPEAASR